MDRWAGRLPKMEYPDYAAEIEQIRLTGITTDLLDRIIERHQGCQRHMMDLYGRYRTGGGQGADFYERAEIQR